MIIELVEMTTSNFSKDGYSSVERGIEQIKNILNFVFSIDDYLSDESLVKRERCCT